MKDIKSVNDLVGHEVAIYPGDTNKKYGKIIDISEQGILFCISKSQDKEYNVGSFHFISFSARLSFSTIN